MRCLCPCPCPESSPSILPVPWSCCLGCVMLLETKVSRKKKKKGSAACKQLCLGLEEELIVVAGPPNWVSLRLGDGVWVCWGLGSCCFLLRGLGAVVPPSCSSAAGLGAVHHELIYIWSDSESPHPWKPRRFSPGTRIWRGAALLPSQGWGSKAWGNPEGNFWGGAAGCRIWSGRWVEERASRVHGGT